MKAGEVDWQSAASHLLQASTAGTASTLTLTDLPGLTAHVWLHSSGSTGTPSLVALSKTAMLASAAAVNAHLHSDDQDHWLCALPRHHVAGLSIAARCALSGARLTYLDTPWSAEAFADQLSRQHVTLSALVPTQVHDLVLRQRRAPATLRALVVGGAQLEPELYHSARALGWPLLPSYGLTECCSQVATASLDSLATGHFPALQLLPHLRHRLAAQGTLMLHGPSLLSGIFDPAKRRFHDPKVDGWLTTRDRGRLSDGHFQFISRLDWLFKVRGHQVELGALQGRWQTLNPAVDSHLIAAADARDGHRVELVVAGPLDAATLETVEAFNRMVRTQERIRQLHSVKRLRRSPLGKFRHAAQIEALGQDRLAHLKLDQHSRRSVA